MLELSMRKFIPYILITIVFGLFIGIWHKNSLAYKFNPTLIHDYLRSQDIEDPKGLIKDRIIMSDSDTYQATGYLYATGSDPTKYNFQHPPLIKYLFGVSILLTGNPYWVQIIFGLIFLFLTYFLSSKVLMNRIIKIIPPLLLIVDPLFGSMMTETLLDLGQAVFALGYIILVFFFPEAWIFQGIILGLFAASKFWSTAVVIVGLVYIFKLFIKKEKINLSKVVLSFVLAFITFSLIYIVSLIKGLNIFFFLAKDLKYMLNHDSAGEFGGSIILFLKSNIFWAVGLIGGIWMAIKTKTIQVQFFFFLLPLIYLLSISTQLPFARYYLIILPFVYLNIVSFLLGIGIIK